MSRNPIENPTANITNFTRSLECMDNLLIQHDAPRITITAQDVPNMTGDGNSIAGTKDMLITSISKLSQRSRRIRFVSYGTDLRDIILLHKAHDARDNFVTPDYFIRGAITQLDKNVMSSRIGAAANDDSWNAAFSGGQGVSFIGLDLNIGLVSSLQMIPGVTSNNVLALWDRGAGTDIGGRINSVGTFFDFGIDRRDGVGQAIRNMTDLAVIEIIGKLLDLPYLTCLPLNHHSPAVQALIQREYQRYSQNPRKLIRTVQARLKHFNYYEGPIHGIMDRQTSLALEYYRNLYQRYSPTGGSGALDFDLYYQIMYGQQYAWHFDQLRYASQPPAPYGTYQTSVPPQALRYNTARDAGRGTPHAQPAHQPYTQPTTYTQPTNRQPIRQQEQQQAPTNNSRPTEAYSPPRVASESIRQDRRAHHTPLDTPALRTRSSHTPKFGNPNEWIALPGSQPPTSHSGAGSTQARPLANSERPFGQKRLGQSGRGELSQRQYGQTQESLNDAHSDTGLAGPNVAHQPRRSSAPREAAFGLPPQTPQQKNWPAEQQRYPYERGESWDRSISQELKLYEHYRP